MRRPKVTVVIPTRNNFDLMVNAVNQLCIKTDYPEYEVLLVSTSPSEQVRERIHKWAEHITNWPVRVCDKTDEFNFAKANTDTVYNNVSSDTEYVLFMNDDCEAVNDVLSILVNFCETAADVGTVSAQLRHKDERIQGMGYTIYEYENNSLELQQESSGQMDGLYYSRKFEVSANPAVCMMTSKKLFERLGGFSEIYIEDYADVEYSLKCRLEGRKNYCLGYAIALHYGWQTRGINKTVKDRIVFDYRTNLVPFMEFYKNDLRDAGAFRYRNRVIKQKDWCLGVSDKIESNFKDYIGGDAFRDPSTDINLKMQMDFEQRYDLRSDDGKLHVLMVGHKDGCGWARVDNPAYMINKCIEDITAFPTSVITPELINWAHIFVWEVPVPSGMNGVRDFLYNHQIPQAFEIDDDYLHLDKFNLARSTVDPDAVIDWINKTQMLTVTREELGQFYQKRAEDKDKPYAVLPNCINFDKFPEVEYKTEDDKIRLGWMGGCTHFSDLEVVAPVMHKLKEKYGDRLEICLFGWNGQLKPPFFASRSVFGDLSTTHINFVDVYSYYSKLASLNFDICFIPLADIPFNNIGKSPIKYLEASAARIPSVVSNSPVFSFVEDGSTGMKASSEKEWETKLTELIENKDLRLKLSSNSFDLVYNKFNLEKEIYKWGEAYRALALSGPTVTIVNRNTEI